MELYYIDDESVYAPLMAVAVQVSLNPHFPRSYWRQKDSFFAAIAANKIPFSPIPPTTSKMKQKEELAAKSKQYWLLKTEPAEWSWEDQAANGGFTKWDGVKNRQAQKHLKAMKLDDLCFFYHSGAKARRVVGVVTVVREWYSEEGGDGVVVDVKSVGEMRKPVELGEMKGDIGLKDLAMFRQSRLSVVAVSERAWQRICEMGGGFEGDGGGNGGNESGEDGDGNRA